jgi:hypothetical protein
MIIMGKRIASLIRASLGALISHGIFIFPREISSFSLGKMKIPLEISVPKLALINDAIRLPMIIMIAQIKETSESET